MGLIGNAVTFAVGAAIGAAAGVAVSRLVAPTSGEETQQTVDEFRQEVVAAGQSAREEKEAALMHRFRQTVSRAES
ncbi:MAG: hypothetical protein AB7V46_18450 [Thermomicrobiales bacterium]